MKRKLDINKLVRENIRMLKPYQSARNLVNNTDMILMDANENPFPIGYNRYPDPIQGKLKAKIGEVKNIPPDNIFLGNGSDEIIDLLIRAFCEPKTDSILINIPTYGMYEVCANINNVNVIKTILDPNFQIDINQMLEQSKQAKIIFICSPNNPTGNLIKRESITQILDMFRGLIVIDEAYIDFAEDPGFISEIENYPNLIVMQTFSKARAMAGIRLGMAFMITEIIQILNKIKYPYNISILNQKVALNALDDDSVYTGIKAILDQKKWLISKLKKLDIVIKIWPSDANFLLVQFKDHNKVFEFLKNQGIILRDRSNEINCEGCLRITIGKSLDNLSLITCLKQFEQVKKSNYEKDIIYRS